MLEAYEATVVPAVPFSDPVTAVSDNIMDMLFHATLCLPLRAVHEIAGPIRSLTGARSPRDLNDTWVEWTFARNFRSCSRRLR